jgi:hypothetical protein
MGGRQKNVDGRRKRAFGWHMLIGVKAEMHSKRRPQTVLNFLRHKDCTYWRIPLLDWDNSPMAEALYAESALILDVECLELLSFTQ